MAKQIEFKCTPIRSTFMAKDSDYKIYATDCFDKSIKSNSYGNVTILGDLPELSLGVEYTVKATEEDGRYGVSYKVRSIIRDKPLSDSGVRLFLEEILPVSQVDELMREYPNIIDLAINHKMEEVDLNKLYNIKTERIKVIERRILENFIFAQVVDEFKGLIDFRVVKELYNKYKDVDKIKNEIKNNPYEVLCSIGNFSFKTADALLLNFEKDCSNLENPPIKFEEPLISSLMRMRASIIHCLEENEFKGNTKMELRNLKTKCKSLTPQCMCVFDEVILNYSKISIIGKYISKRSTYQTELYIADKLQKAIKLKDKWDIDISGYKSDGEMELTDQQINVIQNVMDYKVSICNGFSGSGKSASTSRLVKILQDNNKSITILAPTGRASKVVASYAKYPASTIHRLLFQLEGDVIKSDVIIVDEASMCDVFVFKWLLEYIDFNYTKLLLIGDSAQASSVGAGNVLHDLLNSKVIPSVWLDKIFRYGIGGIMSVATDTRNCKTFLEEKSGSQVIGQDKGYVFHHSNTPQSTISIIKQLYTKLISNGATDEDILILSPYNIGDYGSSIINSHLHPIANPQSVNSLQYIETDGCKFHVGDLVLQTKNNYKSAKFINDGYDKNESIQCSYDVENEFNQTLICNGEVGKIECIYNNLCIINFDGVKVVYGKFELQTCRLAYSISIHKAQGGNAKYVILITAKEHGGTLSSNLLYVGETRARERLFHIGDVSTINKCVKIKDEEARLTHLKELMIGEDNYVEVI